MSETDSHDIGRRDFLRRTGQAAAIAGVGAMLAREAAAARKRVEPADPHAPKTGSLLKEGETIGLGIVGVGGMGGSHLGELLDMETKGANIQVRAVSDVYMRRKRQAVERVAEQAKRNIEAYTNYRELIERDDIHGIVVATPDHWHAQITLDALDAGKDVYCQKPVTLYTEEAIEVRDRVLATGRVFQCGAQFCSDDWWWQARDFIKKGGIGEVIWAQADYSRNSGTPENPQGGEWNYTIHDEATDNPAGGDHYIDWPQWLGPAKKRPFSKARYFQFRKYWDYSGGIASDLLYHYVAPLTLALDAKAPERATAAGGIFVQHDDREVPDTLMMNLDYPDDYTIVLTSSMANSQGNPVIIRGHRATIRPKDGGIQVTPERNFVEWFKKEFGTDDLFIAGQPRMGHMENWLHCMRTREKCHLDAETAYRAEAAIRMGCDSYIKDEVIYWDNAKERYVRKHPRPNRLSKVPAIKS